jgi:hypothetical protein
VNAAAAAEVSVSWAQWVMSPGFGGLAAVVAAVVAFIGVSRTVKAQREANRKQQWWERARWALDLTLEDDSTTRAIGFEVLDALARSEYASEHEAEVIDAAVAPALEAYVNQGEDEPARGAAAGATDPAEADSSPEAEQEGDADA